jgi:tetratricopeptide (TPR) repeat protein
MRIAVRGTGVFRSNSYGLGGLQASGSPSANVLRSSIESRANYTVRAYAGLPEPIGLAMPALPQAGGDYQPAFRPSAYMDRSALAAPTYSAPATSALNTAADYLAAIGAPIAPQTGSEVITSMAPREKGALGEYVAKGEKAFREGDYEAALKEFQKAYAVDSKNPETLLSLAHACFAATGSSYYRTSYYLRKALKYLPELPLAPLSPKSFFGDESQYASKLARLEDRTKRFPNDADSYLALAYFRWFDRDVEGARQALAQARRYAKSAEMTASVATFWDGMVASGKVSGELTPTTQPSAAGAPNSVALQSPSDAQPSADKETK